MDKKIIDKALTGYKKELEKGLDNSTYTWAIYKNAFLSGYKQRTVEENEQYKGETFSNGGHPRSEFSSGAGFREV